MTSSNGTNGSSPAASTQGSGGRLSVLRNRNFTLLWVGQIIAHSGSWMALVAQGWLVYDLTNSPFYLGLVGMARAIPMIVLPPLGGVLADRLPRLQLLKVTQAINVSVALILAVLVHSGLIEIWQIVLISFTNGAIAAFDQPSRQALIPDLVRPEDLAKAAALNSSAWQGAALFGPTLAGVTIAAVGIAGAFYANAFGFLAVVAALYLMKGVPERSVAPSGMGFADDLRAGLRYVRATPLILALIVLSAVSNIFGRSYQSLLPVFAVDVFGEGEVGLGVMFSLPGAGTLVGAAVLAFLADVKRKGVVFLGAMLVFSAVLLLFSVNRSFYVGLGLLFLIGATWLVFSSMMTTMLQLEAIPEMRGRVMSLVTVTMQGFAPLGGLLLGAIATEIGTPEAVALSAGVVAIVAAIATIVVPQVRDFRYEYQEQAPDVEPVPATASALAPAQGQQRPAT